MAWTMKNKAIWICIILFRLWNSLFVRTYFNPDEYWQSVEVAHRMVYGYGYLTWEWGSDARIRGYAHPLIFTLLYKCLQLLNLDSRWAVAYSPRLLHGLLAAATDYNLHRLACKYFDAEAARWALLCQLCCWFMFYTLVRTYSSSMETLFTTMALAYWPWQNYSSDKMKRKWESERFKALCLAALGVLIRPTNAMIWVYLGTKHLLETKDRMNLIFWTVLPIASVAICTMLGIDYLFYGVVTFVPYNFLLFNLIQGNGRMYGVHSWHWYFTQGFPAISSTFLPLIVLGWTYSPRHKRGLMHLILWILCVYSFSAHKEFRFLLPILPASLVYAGYGLKILRQDKRIKLSSVARNQIMRGTIAVILSSNIAAIVYMSQWHQSAPIAVMDHAAAIAQAKPNVSVHFWTACHATPYYSFIHRNISLWFPDCSPQNRKRPEGSESEQLQANITKFLETRYNWYREDECPVATQCAQRPLPDYAVLFTGNADLSHLLQAGRYVEEKTFFHSHWNGDADIKDSLGEMTIYRREKE